jgi:pyridoxamine 5'-phosphate oxidase
MKQDISNFRKSYNKSNLDLSSIKKDPIVFFKNWFENAVEDNLIEEANAMILSTIGHDGFPKGRVVLLKEYSEDGFIFFSNYNSEKGESIKKNKNVCLTFFWPSQERQIIVKGFAEKTSKKISDIYFKKRPKGSKLGSIVSKQSRLLVSIEELENDLEVLNLKYDNKQIIRPDHWGGYIVRPLSIEFWQGRPNRLHDRILCVFEKSNWNINRIAP